MNAGFLNAGFLIDGAATSSLLGTAFPSDMFSIVLLMFSSQGQERGEVGRSSQRYMD